MLAVRQHRLCHRPIAGRVISYVLKTEAAERMALFLLLLSVAITSADEQSYFNVNASLTDVPTDIPNATWYVNLRNNLISNIPAGIFSSLELKLLRLEENNFSKFPDLSSAADHLEWLFLDYNKIKFINSDRLNILVKLNGLQLGHNPLLHVPGITVSNLRYLSLDNCSLTEFPSIKDPASLQYLKMPYNDIAIIPDNYFMAMVSLEAINVVGNPRLTGLITLSTGSSPVQEIYASGTNISELPELIRRWEAGTIVNKHVRYLE